MTATRDVGDDGTDTPQADKADLVRAFLAASRQGEFEALLALLDPDIVVRADQVTGRADQPGTMHIDAEIRGADAVTRAFLNRVWAPVPALIDGETGLVYAQDGEPRAAFRFTTRNGTITAIDILAELSDLDIVMS